VFDLDHLVLFGFEVIHKIFGFRFLDGDRFPGGVLRFFPGFIVTLQLLVGQIMLDHVVQNDLDVFHVQAEHFRVELAEHVFLVQPLISIQIL
jgi:hypothetical protein